MLDATTEKPLVRGCGVRVKGGLYLETGFTEENGIPPHEYMICPPQPVDADALGITPVGVQLIDVGGVYHVFDWIGSEHYPNVQDFLSEMSRHGLSRRISRKEDFSKLTRDSRLMLMHSRAVITNAEEVWDSIGNSSRRWCPIHGFDDTRDYSQTCLSLYAEVVEGGEPLGVTTPPAERDVRRTIGDSHYIARPPLVDVQYELGVFAAVPIGKITVIRDGEGGSHEEAMSAAQASELPVRLEDQ